MLSPATFKGRGKKKKGTRPESQSTKIVLHRIRPSLSVRESILVPQPSQALIQTTLALLEGILSHSQQRKGSRVFETNGFVIVEPPSGLSAVLHPQRHDPHGAAHNSRTESTCRGALDSDASGMVAGAKLWCIDKIKVEL